MKHAGASWWALVLLAGLMGGVVALQTVHARRSGVPAGMSENLLYVRSPDVMARLALSYDSLLADLYWIRAVQHYGGTRLSTDPNRQFDILYPLLDVATSLDPHLNVAYLFGAVFLAEPPPGGPGRTDLAIALLEKGLRSQPQKFEFAQAIGFVHYWWRQDYKEAAAWFSRTAEFPNAPFWMATLAAVTLAEGGNRESSRLLWRQIAENGETAWFRDEALRRLRQLDAMDQIDRLQRVVHAFRESRGSVPLDWRDLQRAGYLPGAPLDPLGVPYGLESGVVTLGRGSRLFPLPLEPQRIR